MRRLGVLVEEAKEVLVDVELSATGGTPVLSDPCEDAVYKI